MPVVADALDADQVAEAVARARPDVIVHQLTAIPETIDMRHPERAFEPTNRLRTEGTDHLLSAGQAVGVRRFVAQSNVPRTRAPARPSRARTTRSTARRPRDAPESSRDPPPRGGRPGATWTEGIVLRYGWFYGPGTSMAPGESYELVRKRKFPLVGDGGGVWSFIHVADAAAATVAAIENGSRGIYNVVDDDPAAVAEWLPALARAARRQEADAGAAVHRAVFAGEFGVVLMTDIRGASNAKAKRELAWRPAHPSWRQGFAAP